MAVFNSSDRKAADQMRQMMGPGQVDQMIRQAIHLCWIILPKKKKTVAELEKNAIEAYSRIITRYPAMGRADDARKKLAELKAPIPNPTAEAIAASKAEEESREEMGRFGRLVGNFRKHPNVALAAKSGEPSMEDEQVDSPVAFMKHIESSMKGEAAAPASNNKLGVETVSPGNGVAPGPNQPIPGSGTATQSDTTPTAPPQALARRQG